MRPIRRIQHPTQQTMTGERLRNQLLDGLRRGSFGKTHLVVWPKGQGQIKEWFESLPFELWRKKNVKFWQEVV